jgi:hypothetical protein
MPVAPSEASPATSTGVVDNTAIAAIFANQPRLSADPATAALPPETAAVVVPAAVSSAKGGVRDRNDELTSASSSIAAMHAGHSSMWLWT